MDMRIERTIDKPPPLVEAALRTGASTWLPGLASEDADTTELDVRIAGTRIARRVLVATGPVAAGDGPVRCRLPISWAAELHPERYPTLTGSLEVEDMASRQTRLVLVASYDPPAGVVGDLADRAILHAVAEGSVERFMTRTAAVLDREAMSLGLEASRPFEHGE